LITSRRRKDLARLREALGEYANPENWTDINPIGQPDLKARIVWLGCGETSGLEGPELAQQALKPEGRS